MTREEILQYIKSELDNNEDAEIYLDTDDYKVIVEALEQQPSEDCVSRQAIDQNIYDYAESNGLSYANMKNYILDTPSVTPVHKVGKWENGNPICPCCGEDKFKDLEADIWADWQPKYCPNCGARIMSESIKNCNNCIHHTDADEIHGITPCGSCGVEKKNFEQKTEMERIEP